ncbi:MAG: valine--tRNA ligase [Sphingomonas sp.]|uniref:valine--tRNA ligase n=1 Tax=Sphingomonas sp. TaxID=28214 RepID=UPI0035A9506F|nr:valine--tRNA ligase [Sphingomonas sp.]
MSELPKTFDPAEIEQRWYAHWEENGLFHPDRPGAEPWTIVNPPPNVTGSLHIGHALDNTLQDILTRHARLQGKDALWVVGTDHAGIATQMVVERQLAAKQDKRTNYTREAFVEKVWDWKRESGGEITQQLRRLGCSMDWANERFTMDEGFSKAVVKVFVDLYNQGLLYRDKRLVNWDPGLGTAISDLEVETHEVKGSFWHFKYPLADGVTLADGRDHIVVATTRPETMLADMAVAVNAADARYQSVIGKFIEQPIAGRRIPIIADDHADPELGSGAVKITPGHDFNDFEVGKRAGFKAGEMLNMLDAKANVVQTADGLVPAAFVGLHRFKKDGVPGAREAVVEQMKALGCLVPFTDKDGAEHDAEPRTIQTPFGDRSGVVIEPWLTDQWYVDAATLAKAPIEAVRSGAIEIVPKTWEKTFFNWMENIQPWCVSRQLWWGHRIPAWFGPNATNKEVSLQLGSKAEHRVFVAETFEAALPEMEKYYGVDRASIVEVEPNAKSILGAELEVDGYLQIPVWRDPDVLDTWFSSALWPFATMGWPDDSSPSPLRREGRGEGLPSSAAPEAAPLPTLSPEGRGPLGGRYPNDVLISGFDILFFWDARMMMQGMHFMGDVPFRKLYLHGLVRAADGQKMSKSKGNTVDPLGLIDQYGADALRFFMAAMESQGRDIKMDERRVEGYRNFATKLWNAARFAQGNGIVASTSLKAPAATLAVNKWIIGETIRTVQAVDAALADLRFDGAANAIYQFVWSQFCDWYLELIKPVLGQMDAPATGPEADETRLVAGWVLDQILVLLHPFMPFITEELWSKMGARDYELIVAKWPAADASAIDDDASREIDWLIKAISDTRALRNELGIAPGAPIANNAIAFSQSAADRIERNKPALIRLGRFADVVVTASQSFEFEGQAINTAQFAVENGAGIQLAYETETFFLSVVGKTDFSAEKERLAKAIAAAEKERDSLAGRLNNPSFVERAKPEAIEKARADHADKSAEAERLSAALARLG